MENNNTQSKETIMGLDPQVYNALASQHSKNDIFLWLVGGYLFIFFSKSSYSIITMILLVFPGVFVASFASILTFYVEIKKRKIIPKTNSFFVLLFFTLWMLIDLVYPVLLSICYVFLMENVINSWSS